MTLLALSLVLLFLGYTDMSLYLNNTKAQEIDITGLINGEETQEKLIVRGGYLDLKNAVSTSGSIELDALLVPLTEEPGRQPFKVFVETRDPEIIKLVQKYQFEMDTEFLRKKFFEENKDKFYPQLTIEAMKFSSIVANRNQVKIIKLLRSVGLDVEDDVVFIAEGKQPPKYRGIFFLIVGLLGLLKSYDMFKKARDQKESVNQA